MYDSILYPTDGSPAAQAAIEYARAQAEAFGASIHVLYVVEVAHAGVGLASDVDVETGGGMVGSPEGVGSGMIGVRERGGELTSELESHATEVVGRIADEFEGVETHEAVRTGIPADTILEYVDEADIDMVVMSTHGRSGLDRFLIGSVTEKVVRSSPVPVLTVQGSGD